MFVCMGACRYVWVGVYNYYYRMVFVCRMEYLRVYVYKYNYIQCLYNVSLYVCM